MSQIKIYILLYLCIGSLSTLSAQEQALNLFAFGQKTDETSKSVLTNQQIFKINGETGEENILASINDLQVIDKGFAFNSIDKAYLFWTKQGSKYNMHTFDIESGQRFDYPYQFDYPLLDVQYDLRNKTFLGLQYDKVNKALQILHLTKATVNVIAQFPEIRGITLGATAFDSNRGVYIFAANDKSYNEHLYTIDLSTKTVLDKSKIDNYYFSEIQYDVQDSKTYAICRKKSNTDQFFFVELDLAQGRPIIIAPIYGLSSAMTGTSSFDQKEGIYYFKGKDKDLVERLYMVDAVSGDIIFKSKMAINVLHIEADNSAFALEYFKETSNVTSTIMTKIRPVTKRSNELPDEHVVTLLSSVVKDVLKLNINLPEHTGVTVAIRSVTGEHVLTTKIFNQLDPEKNIIDLTNLEAGIYFVELKTEDKIYSKKLIKR